MKWPKNKCKQLVSNTSTEGHTFLLSAAKACFASKSFLVALLRFFFIAGFFLGLELWGPTWTSKATPPEVFGRCRSASLKELVFFSKIHGGWGIGGFITAARVLHAPAVYTLPPISGRQFQRPAFNFEIRDFQNLCNFGDFLGNLVWKFCDHGCIISAKPAVHFSNIALFGRYANEMLWVRQSWGNGGVCLLNRFLHHHDVSGPIIFWLLNSVCYWFCSDVLGLGGHPDFWFTIDLRAL